MERSDGRASWGWALLLAGTGACGAAQPTSSSPASAPASRLLVPADARGLKVMLSGQAREICVNDAGCAGEPKGSTRIKPLEPGVRAAVAEALSGIGLEVVGESAERDMSADVEWRGTDTIALRLRDLRGRSVEEATYRRSLEPCRELGDLSWESCWQANFEQMKLELTRPLLASAALQALGQRARGGESLGSESLTVSGTGSTPALPAQAATLATAPSASTTLSGVPAALPERLEAAQVQATVARYREAMKRQCWQPALEARPENASTSARVSLSVTVAPSGGVDNVTTLGEPAGYPRLAECVASQLGQWRFPASKSRSTLSIPFVFTSD